MEESETLQQGFVGSYSEAMEKYLLDASEAESWMQERDLRLKPIKEERDEAMVRNILEEHTAIGVEIEDFCETMKQLEDTSESLIAAKHPSSKEIIERQTQLAKQYSELKTRAIEMRTKWEHSLRAFAFFREVDDFQEWITTVHYDELWQDCEDEDIAMLQVKFQHFASETESIGQEKMSKIDSYADKLVNANQFGSTQITDIKDILMKSWTDLLALIECRSQTLNETIASEERKKPFKKSEALPKYLSSPESTQPLEGSLIRKQEMKSPTKKAINRSWNKVYVLVKDHNIYVYKDQKQCQQEPDNGESPLNLIGSTADIAFDYRKRCHVFRLKLDGAGQYLFWAKDEEEMRRWILHFSSAAIEDSANSASSQTLPMRGTAKE